MPGTGVCYIVYHSCEEALSGQMTLFPSNCVCIHTLIEPTYVLHTEQAYGLFTLMSG